ncbi:MAG TPA: DUF6056 family protein [Kofleriaceae bacterium]|jgi:hypothetical protein
MASRGERLAFLGAVLGLGLLFFIQAAHAPVLLDDWFELRYWRDHAFGLTAIWEHARHDHALYNPRIGEVLLGIVDGSRAIQLIATPIVQLALLAAAFVLAFGRRPRANLRDLALLVFLQAMIWLVVPAPGIIYFYRPIATNYLWAFTITLAVILPYRLALAADEQPPPRRYLVPIMVVAGWLAGMCNEHTGPTAMLAMAGFVYAAWRMRRLRAWMVAGMVGLYIGYPMLILAPGESVRYGGLATVATPAALLAARGVAGCLAIVRYFVGEARLGIIVFAATVVRYLATVLLRGERVPALPRRVLATAAALLAAAGAIVATLFVSPVASDRVLFASGVLLAAAFAVVAEHLFAERVVYRLVTAACVVVVGYHAVRFVASIAELEAENDERLAILEAASPGSDVVVPSYRDVARSRWELGDDFRVNPWLRDYVAGELFDLARIDVDKRNWRAEPRYVAERFYDPPVDRPPRPPIAHLPTYRQLLGPVTRQLVATRLALAQTSGLAHYAIELVGIFDDPRHRPLVVLDWTPARTRVVEGEPYDTASGPYIRMRRATLPAHIDSMYVIGCGQLERVEPIDDGDHVLLAVDEQYCRGVFTAIACERTRCWMAGWY